MQKYMQIFMEDTIRFATYLMQNKFNAKIIAFLRKCACGHRYPKPYLNPAKKSY
jgi:hypothetical protein